MKVYIAGKITGDPEYRNKFKRAARKVKSFGTALLPSILPDGMTRADYMRICFAMIDCCDIVCFLPDYKCSPGAMLEHGYCEYLGKAMIYLEPEETSK